MLRLRIFTNAVERNQLYQSINNIRIKYTTIQKYRLVIGVRQNAYRKCKKSNFQKNSLYSQQCKKDTLVSLYQEKEVQTKAFIIS